MVPAPPSGLSLCQVGREAGRTEFHNDPPRLNQHSQPDEGEPIPRRASVSASLDGGCVERAR